MTAPTDDMPGPVSGDVATMEKIVALSKRRGFVFPSSEIYGGVGSTYDYGHYGVLPKTHVKNPPCGIAPVGKSLRNEITPGNFIFRPREFEQMEMEFFVALQESEGWFRYWLAERERWYVELGLRPDHLRLRAHDADELSHYSS